MAKAVVTSWTICVLVTAPGCKDNVQLPSAAQMATFLQAGPGRPQLDLQKLAQVSTYGPHRVQADEVVEVTLSAFLAITTAQQALPTDQVITFTCRVNESGTITLPVIGPVYVANKTLAQIEALIIKAYYPAYTKSYPSVYVRLVEAKRCRVSIAGAVARPGVYELRADQMSLLVLLMEAGGITQAGAGRITILRPAPGGKAPETIVLPIKGTNIPFSDVPLQDADTVIVEGLVVPVFTVLGLVNRPGNFEYPPDAQYNLVQAIAFAGGLNLALDPRYAVVYRLDVGGSIVHAAFPLVDGKTGHLTEAAAVPIKPGDIVAIEHTPRTRSREFLEKIFNVHIGAYLPIVR